MTAHERRVKVLREVLTRAHELALHGIDKCQEREAMLCAIGTARVAVDVYADGQRTAVDPDGTPSPWIEAEALGVTVPHKGVRGYPRPILVT